MPTDEERLEVAAKLRNLAEVTAFIHLTDSNFVSLLSGIFLNGVEWDIHDRNSEGLFINRLADLIDPEERTCRNVSDDKRGFICSGCGTHVRGGSCCHSYVDDAGTRWYTTADKSGLNFCPNCGRKVVYK